MLPPRALPAGRLDAPKRALALARTPSILHISPAHGSLVTRIRRILHVPIEDSVRSPGWATTLLLGVMFTTGVVSAVGMIDVPELGRGRAVTEVTAVEPAFRSVPPIQHSDATGAAATEMAAADLQNAEVMSHIFGLVPGARSCQGFRAQGP